MRLHFSIGGHDYRRTTRFRQGIHFSITQVLFADHMHRRSGVDNKFSFLRFKGWWRRQTPIFRRWEECSCLRWWGLPGQIIPSEGFWSRMSAWRATAFVNFAHRIGFRMSGLFRKIDEDFGGSISWNTQPNCRVFGESAFSTGLTVL